MRIFSKGTLRGFWEEYLDARASLETWYQLVELINFENPNMVIKFFKDADVVKNGRIVFNICKNKYRLIAKFEYERQMVFVRFVGTHKDYDKIGNIKDI